MKGTVLRDEGSHVIVDLDGKETPCVIRKSLRRRTGRRRKPVVVGDRVTVEFSGEGAAVVGVDERRTQISRQAPGDPRHEQILVANVDFVLIVASTRNPDLVPGLIDRFLVTADSREIAAGIAINKIDHDPERENAPLADLYRGLGYDVVETSAETGAGLDAVRTLLRDRTTTLLGHSGVGKSSLANALDPSIDLRTADVHEGTGRGVHTTTTVSLLRLPWGGYLVDTPGIREFGLWRMDPRDLRFWFREIAARLADCRFSDCLHEHEPDCAVQAAVEAGAITAARYESYLRILAGLR